MSDHTTIPAASDETAHLHQLAQQIATGLAASRTQPWEYRPRLADDGRLLPAAVIYGLHGQALVIHRRSAQRIELCGSFGTAAYHATGQHMITVAITRPVRQIVTAIERRLLPQYGAELARAQERQAIWQRQQAKQAASAEALRASVDGVWCVESQTRFLCPTGRGASRHEVSVWSDLRVRITTADLSMEQARAVLAILQQPDESPRA